MANFSEKNLVAGAPAGNATLTKAEIVTAICEQVELQHHHAKEVVDLFFEEMRETLESGEEIKLSGFGNFELHDKRERPGRNPKTGKPVAISPRRVVTFNAGQKLRKAVAGITSRGA